MRQIGAFAVALTLAVSPAFAETLTIQHAIEMALAGDPDIAASRAAQAEAREQQVAASHGWLPQLTLQEGWQRGNQPVFTFSSLLAQRHFTADDFAIASLNHPDALSNYRGAILLHQPLFDAGDASARATTAQAERSLADSTGRQATLDTAAHVVEAYGNVLAADAEARAADAAVKAADEDLARAEARRDAGTVTNADVLALQVHRAEMQARQIAARGNGRIARAALNRLIGAPLDADWQFTSIPMRSTNADATDAATASRPDVEQAALRANVASSLADAARAARMPHVGLDGSYEWNGQSWTERAGAWVAGIRGEWSFSTSGAEAARSKAAAYALERARLERTSVETAAALDVRSARVRLDTARARQEVALGAVLQARESERIIRDRYDAGIAGVTDVLRAATADRYRSRGPRCGRNARSRARSTAAVRTLIRSTS
jgi:outer membrane protein TolC